MITKHFVCTAFDGTKYEEDYDFYLSRADLLKINLGSFVGLDVLVKRLIDARKGKEIMDIIDEIIMTAVGKESNDHRRFLRTPEIKEEFRESEAYSQLFEELVMDANKSAEFLIGCLPADLQMKVAEQKALDEQAEEPAK